MLLVHILFAAALALPPDSAGWETLTERPVKVECTQFEGTPWCRSYGIIAAPLDQVAGALRDMRHSEHLFESVDSIEVLSENVLHITLENSTLDGGT